MKVGRESEDVTFKRVREVSKNYHMEKKGRGISVRANNFSKMCEHHLLYHRENIPFFPLALQFL
jgi:GTP cyclohydrolase I